MGAEGARFLLGVTRADTPVCQDMKIDDLMGWTEDFKRSILT